MTQLPPDLESLLVQQVGDRERTHLETAIGAAATFLSLAAITVFALDPPEQNL